jgi:hypothetical protein
MPPGDIALGARFPLRPWFVSFGRNLASAKTTNAIPRRLPLPPHPLSSREGKPAEGFPKLSLPRTRRTICQR